MRTEDVNSIEINKNWQEYAVKNAYPLIKSDELQMKYMPGLEMDEARYPDRTWFWNTSNTIRPEWTKEYIDAVYK